MESIVVDNVTMQYGTTKALDNVSMQINPGKFGLVGPNGAGKTTLIRVLATIIKPKCGTISTSKISWENPNEVRDKLGYLPQNFGMYPYISVDEALNHSAVLKGLRKPVIPDEIDRVLEMTNLSEQRDKKVKNLSGGMVRRLGIAQALLGNPELIILDEPTAGLDPEERVRFREMIGKFDKNATVFISTHIISDVETCCDQIAFLHEGRIIQSGNISEILPRDSDTLEDYYMELIKDAKGQ